MSATRWVVENETTGDAVTGAPFEPTLSRVLERVNDVAAAADGRAFVNGVRGTNPRLVLRVGDVVEVWAPRPIVKGDEGFEILAFEEDLLVVQKPASLTTTADHRGTRSLVTEVEAWLEAKAPHLRGGAHPVSRLDVGVSGAVLFALTHEARKAVERATDEGALHKGYVAIARGSLDGEGTFEDAVGQEKRGGQRRPALQPGGKPSLSKYRALARAKNATLLELVPLTGRTHQLRLHVASAGAPLFGDRAHGGPTRITSKTGSVRELTRIMLHAARIELTIEGRTPLVASSPIPNAMLDLWSALDGDPDAWNALGSPRGGPLGS